MFYWGQKGSTGRRSKQINQVEVNDIEKTKAGKVGREGVVWRT